jgi:hypothetical protein
VLVYNEAYIYIDDYKLTEIQQFPEQDTCNYNIIVNIDSTVNWRIVYGNFACNFGQTVFADVNDGSMLIPFQIIQDTIASMSVQGSGTVSDTLMMMDYTLKNDTLTTLWKAKSERL